MYSPLILGMREREMGLLSRCYHSIHTVWVSLAKWHLSESLSKFWLITAWNKCGTKELCSTLHTSAEWTCCSLNNILSFTSTWVPPFTVVQGCVIFPNFWHFPPPPQRLKGVDMGNSFCILFWFLNTRVYLFLTHWASNYLFVKNQLVTGLIHPSCNYSGRQ